MIMGIKVLECKLTSVNRCVEVEHLRESIDQEMLMYSQETVDGLENLTLMTASLKELKRTLDSNPRINDVKSMG